MKSINQIQIAVQEGEPLTEEEMRLCIESQRTIICYYEKVLDGLVMAIREARVQMFEARKMLPQDWLGPDNIPGTPEYKKKLELAKRLFEKATGETL